MIEVDSIRKPGIVAVPSGSLARYNGFWDSLMMLEVPKHTIFLHATSPNIARNRNDAIMQLLALNDFGWIFFLDDDHEFSPRLLMHMLERFDSHANLGALGSLYVKKVPPFEPTLYKDYNERAAKYDRERFTRFTWDEITERTRNMTFPELPVAACGGSGLLVGRTTLEEMSEWFPEDDPAEDIGFCRRVAATGRAVWAQLMYPLGHTQPMTAVPEWSAGDREWLITMTWGQTKGFRVPAKRFHP